MKPYAECGTQFKVEKNSAFNQNSNVTASSAGQGLAHWATRASLIVVEGR